MTPPDDRRTITATEAQHHLGVCPSTLRSWARRGHLYPVGIGPRGIRIYKLCDVLRLRGVT